MSVRVVPLKADTMLFEAAVNEAVRRLEIAWPASVRALILAPEVGIGTTLTGLSAASCRQILKELALVANDLADRCVEGED